MELNSKEKLKQQHRSEWINHYDDSHFLWSTFNVNVNPNLNFPIPAAHLLPSNNSNGKNSSSSTSCKQGFSAETNTNDNEVSSKVRKFFIHQFMSHSLNHYMSEQNERIKLLEDRLSLSLVEKELDEERSSAELTKTVVISPPIPMPNIAQKLGQPLASSVSKSNTELYEEPKLLAVAVAEEVTSVDTQGLSPPLFSTPTFALGSPSSLLPPSSPQSFNSTPSIYPIKTSEMKTVPPDANVNTINVDSDSENDSGNCTQKSPSLMNPGSFRAARPRYPHSKENLSRRQTNNATSAPLVVISPKKLLLPGLDDNPISSSSSSSSVAKKPKLFGDKSTSASASNWIDCDHPKKQPKLLFPRLNSTNSTLNTGKELSLLDSTRDRKTSSSVSVAATNSPSSRRGTSSRKTLIQTKLDPVKLFGIGGKNGKQEDLTNSEEYNGGARSTTTHLTEIDELDIPLKPKIGLHSNSPASLKRKLEESVLVPHPIREGEEEEGISVLPKSASTSKSQYDLELEDIKKNFNTQDFGDDTFFEEPQPKLISVAKPDPLPVQQRFPVFPLTCKARPNKHPNPDVEVDQLAKEVVSYRSIKNNRDATINIGNDTMEVIQGFNRPPGADSPSPTKFKYKPDKAVRKKSERDLLPGTTCDMCREYYNEIASQLNAGDIERIKNNCSKHRQKHVARNVGTPPDFWRTDFPSTEECIAKGYLHIETPDPFMDPKMKNKISRY